MKGILAGLLAILCLPFLALSAQGKELRLLTWHGYAPKELVDKFEQETGYKVIVTYSNNEEMTAKLIATHGAGFDLAQPSQERLAPAQQAGDIYQPIDYSKINEALILPALLKSVKANTRVDDKVYGVPFCWGVTGLLVNRKYAPDVKSFADLLNEKYKGHISYGLTPTILKGLAFALGHDPFALYKNPPQYQKMLEGITQRLNAGKPLVNNYWTDSAALLASLREKRVFVAEGWEHAGFQLHRDNPDIDFVAPATGALGWIDTFALPAKAENVDAAYAWINFMLRPENAAVFTNATYLGAASQGARDLVLPEVKADFERCLPQAVFENIKWYPPLPAEIAALELKALAAVRAAK